MTWRRKTLQVAVVALASVIAGGCGGAGNITGASQPDIEASGPARPSAQRSDHHLSPHHLYVAQGFYGKSAVYHYHLRDDGLPSRKPDGALILDFPFPGSIAIGPDGDLYVSSSGGGSGCKNSLGVPTPHVLRGDRRPRPDLALS